ncbi:MAG: recombinase family protein [Clostridiales bacterium]|nr:recombinase family protein [Clostridiales bacterium]
MEQYVKYLRKSRFDRDYGELSVEETLKRHEAILDRIAEDRGYDVVKTYYEVVSGESIATRPEIQKMLEEVSAGVYTGVLVVVLERLARGNGADQAYISQVFQFSGTKIITPMKVYDPSNEFDEEYFEFGLFMSRREYKTINRRLIRGRDSSASEGKYLGSIAPYGYKRVKLRQEKGYTLEIHPEEGPVVRRIFERYLAHDGTKRIANALNDDGVPTRHGGLWTYATIAQMISNPVYMGKIRRGWSRQIKSVENGVVKRRIRRSGDRSEYSLYDGLHPALVSEADFMRAQEIRSGKKPSARVKDAYELMNPFAGILYCAVCGKRIGRTTSSVKRNTPPRLRCVNGRNCHNRSAYLDVVEKEIISALRIWLKGYQVKLDTVGYADDIAAGQRQISKIDQELGKLSTQLDNAFDLVEQGVYTLDVFRERRAKLNLAIEDLQRKRAKTVETVERLQTSQTMNDSFIPQAEELLSSYDEMTNGERNALLKELLDRIEYEKGADGKIVIDLYPRLPELREQ